ncbi:Cytochrome P450 [Dillenia turbinata]|uniref:Cytochrome P450 n=1 Tax=Dillenia turbinata TaxID=194707 RepID=A0AAN8UZS5_9MAGN
MDVQSVSSWTWVLGALPILLLLLWWWNELRYVVPLKASFRNGIKLPPGDMGFPFIGETLTFVWYFKILRRPDDFINAKRRRYGDGVGMYRTHLFGQPSIIGWTPVIHKFMLRSDAVFTHSWTPNDLVGRNSIVANYGQRHHRLKKFVTMAINRPNALRQVASLTQLRIASAFQEWAHKGTIVAFDEIRKMTLENVANQFVSLRPGPLLDTIGVEYKGLVGAFRAIPLNLPGTAYRCGLKSRKRLLEIFRKELEKKKNKHAKDGELGHDLMDGLMQTTDEDGKYLSDEEVVENIVGLLIAGYESTATSLTWAVYHLAKSPDILQRLREENINLRHKKNGELLTLDDVSELKYTNKVVEETIRIANLTPFINRSADEDVEYQGYTIPRGWKVLLWIRYLHTDPNNFDDPMSFNPDRWDNAAKAGTYMVFGGGSRICAGNNLSRLQIALFLHYLSVETFESKCQDELPASSKTGRWGQDFLQQNLEADVLLLNCKDLLSLLCFYLVVHNHDLNL